MTVYYHWYQDGVYVGVTAANERGFELEPGNQSRIDVVETDNPDFDPIAQAPELFPARRLIWWVRSTAQDVDHYRVEQSIDGVNYTTIGRVVHDERNWSYSLLTDKLTDITTYFWRVFPVDKAGNEGPLAELLPGEFFVRVPDAPKFSATYDAGTQRVTFAAT